jgi:hypothetical protein
VRNDNSRLARRSIKCKLMSIPTEIPAEVTIAPSSTQRRPSRTVTEGNLACISAISSQWVVADLPSNSPVLANRNDPVHTDVMTLGLGDRLEIQSETVDVESSAVTTPPGTRSRSISG